MDKCCVSVRLCSLNLAYQLFSSFPNTNMSPYSSTLTMKIRIWISPCPVFTGPSIKFDWVWPTLTKLWPRLSLNQPFDWDHNLLKLTFHYTLRNQRLDFKSKDGARWTYVVYLNGFVLLIWPSNCSQISPTPICHNTLKSQWSRFEYKFHKSSGLGTIYYVWPGLTNFN